jgi:hypothetical protein
VCDLHPFVKSDDQRVIGLHRFGQTIANRHIGALDPQSPEQPVEDDEHAAEVGIQILGIRGVMHAMVRGGVEYPFERT